MAGTDEASVTPPRLWSLAWWNSRAGLMTALGTLVSVLALILAAATWLSPADEGASGDDPRGSGSGLVARTPWLGIELWQAGRQVSFAAVDDRTFGPYRTAITRERFELRFYRLPPDVTFSICTWTDNSIFYLREGDNLENVPCLAAGTGIADTASGSGDLFVTNEGHTAFAGQRVRQLDERRDAVDISRLATDNVPLGPGRYYLTMMIDADGDRKVSRPEFDYLVLDYGL